MKKYMNKVWKMSVLLFIAVTTWGCDDEKEGSMYQIFEDNPAASFLAEQDEFSEWVAIMRYADLYNALNYASEDFTLFVPNNDAVQRFYEAKGVSGITELGVEYAKALVLQHSVEDSIRVEEFLRKTEVTSLSDAKITISIDTVNAGEVLLNNSIRIYEMGVHTFNAILYYVSDVMTPLVETVYDRVSAPRYSIMKEAVDATGWDKMLSTIADTVAELGIITVNRHYYTLLAPSDEAFAKAGISDLPALKQMLGADENVQDSTNALYQYVAYHVLRGEYKYADLTSFLGADTTRIWSTMAANQVLTVTVDSTTAELYHINKIADKANFVVSACDVAGKNGYLHEIDGYLPIWEPDPSTVVWDLCDYVEVKNIVAEAGFVYQPAVSETEDKINISKAACFVTEMSPSGTSNNSLSTITYITCKDGGRWDECVFHDRVAFNIGHMGSVALRTPTVIRGKYRVEISMVYTSDMAFMRKMTDGNGGMMRVTIDGADMRNVSPYTTITKNAPDVYTATLYDEITFDTTADHELKFVVLDPAASSNGKFSLQFDCITFIPITEE